MFLRYQQIMRIVEVLKPRTIVEIGTWQGDHAILMATEALRHHSHVHYWGFDLFEDASQVTDIAEYNVRSHHAHSKIVAKLEAFQKENPGFTFELIRGNTRETMPQNKNLEWLDPVSGAVSKLSEADFAYIDGGHSIETIQIDYDYLKECKSIIFDDYYVQDENGVCPNIQEVGCNQLVNSIEHVMLPAQDNLPTGGKIQMAGAGVEFLRRFGSGGKIEQPRIRDLKFAVVTTFSDEGYFDYGKRFIETFQEFWPANIDLFVYYDSILPEIESDRIHYVNFARTVPALVGFKMRHMNNKDAHRFQEDGVEDYRFNVIKFCHKVFALTHCALNVDSNYLFWMDADCLTFKSPPVDFLQSLMPENTYTSYLGRRDMHSECGFMGFDLKHSANNEFMEFWSNIYDEDIVFEMPEWHDSYVYDVIRKLFEDKGKFVSNNLRSNIEDDHHPFLNSVLGDYFDHLIGHRRKLSGTSFAADIRMTQQDARWDLVPILPEELLEKFGNKKS